jgi:hypothetical protein
VDRDFRDLSDGSEECVVPNPTNKYLFPKEPKYLNNTNTSFIFPNVSNNPNKKDRNIFVGSL